MGATSGKDCEGGAGDAAGGEAAGAFAGGAALGWHASKREGKETAISERRCDTRSSFVRPDAGGKGQNPVVCPA
jgi:hypothetical protein